MSSDLIIRPGKAADAGALQLLLSETWHSAYDEIIGKDEVAKISARWHTPKVLLGQMAELGSCFLVARSNGQLAGHAYARPSGKDAVELSRLYILPQMQGRGLGSALLEAVRAHFAGCELIKLEVQEANLPAQKFYKAHGFRITGHSSHCGEDSDVPSVLMEATIA